MTILFNTLEYSKGAEAIGIKREHAEYQAEQMAKLIDNNLSTKNDLIHLEQRLTIKLGSMLIAAVGLLAIIMKLT